MSRQDWRRTDHLQDVLKFLTQTTRDYQVVAVSARTVMMEPNGIQKHFMHRLCFASRMAEKIVTTPTPHCRICHKQTLQEMEASWCPVAKYWTKLGSGQIVIHGGREQTCENKFYRTCTLLKAKYSNVWKPLRCPSKFPTAILHKHYKNNFWSTFSTIFETNAKLNAQIIVIEKTADPWNWKVLMF